MTATTAAGQRGFRHELLLHHSAEELLEFVLPIVRDGVAAEEPTLLLVRPGTAEAVLQRVGPSPHLTVHPALAQPGRPALHVRAARQMLASYARVVHQEPVIPPSQWPQWRRLEAALDGRSAGRRSPSGMGSRARSASGRRPGPRARRQPCPPPCQPASR
jgi:hypothetical protein